MFNTNIPIYGILIVLSLLINIIIVLKTYNKKHYTIIEIIGALTYENMGIILGAKLLTYLNNYSIHSEFNFYATGLTSLGGVLGAIIFLLLFAFQFKKDIKEIMNTFMLPIPLMYSISKIGCFIAGCCHGVEYNGILHITYNYSKIAPNNTNLFPVQIIESIIFLIIFMYFYKKKINKSFSFKTLGYLTIACSISKFLLDYLRYEHINKIITLNQIICLVFVIIGVIIIKGVKNGRKQRTN